MVAEGKAEGVAITTINGTLLKQAIPTTATDLNGWDVIKRQRPATYTLLRTWKCKHPGNCLLPWFMKTLDQALLPTHPALLSQLRKVLAINSKVPYSCIQYSSQGLFLKYRATDEPFQLAVRFIFTKNDGAGKLEALKKLLYTSFHQCP